MITVVHLKKEESRLMIIITGGTEDKIMFLLRRTLFFIVILLYLRIKKTLAVLDAFFTAEEGRYLLRYTPHCT